MVASEVSSSLNAFDFRLADARPAAIGFCGSHDVDSCCSLDEDGDGSA